MRIGEFARLTGMPISVLRHYDKEGLLCPSHVDYFTGYRDYTADQLIQARKIELLKSGGLTPRDIRAILEHTGDGKFIKDILDRRESEYQSMLAAISEVRSMVEKEERRLRSGEETPAVLERDAFGDLILKGARLPLPIADRKDLEDLHAAFRSLEEEIRRRNLQRISGFMTLGEEGGREIQVAARVLELGEEIIKELHEDINLPFEEDEQVVGKWKVEGVCRPGGFLCGLGTKGILHGQPGGRDIFPAGRRALLDLQLDEGVFEIRRWGPVLPVPL